MILICKNTLALPKTLLKSGKYYLSVIRKPHGFGPFLSRSSVFRGQDRALCPCLVQGARFAYRHFFQNTVRSLGLD